MEGFAKVLLPKRNPSAVRMNKIQNFTLDSTRKREKQLFIRKSLFRNNNPSSIDFTLMHVELQIAYVRTRLPSTWQISFGVKGTKIPCKLSTKSSSSCCCVCRLLPQHTSSGRGLLVLLISRRKREKKLHFRNGFRWNGKNHFPFSTDNKLVQLQTSCRKMSPSQRASQKFLMTPRTSLDTVSCFSIFIMHFFLKKIYFYH